MKGARDTPSGQAPIGEPHRLPGVGVRIDFEDDAGVPFFVVNRDDGHVELYITSDEHGPTTLRLQDTTAQALGALLAGRYALDPRLNERAARVLGGLTFDWVQVPVGGRAVDRTIAELELRKHTGVTIVAVLRGQVPIVAPEPSMRLEAGDDIVIVSQPTDLAAGRALLGGEA